MLVEVLEILLELSSDSLTDEEQYREVEAKYRLVEGKLGRGWLWNVAGYIPRDLLKGHVYRALGLSDSLSEAERQCETLFAPRMRDS
jgi:hypothetical protein